jgi:hypothetical protein
MQGYFQRVFSKGLLPVVPVVSANPAIKFNADKNIICEWHDLLEIQDKPANTMKLMQSLGLHPSKVVVIGTVEATALILNGEQKQALHLSGV